LVGWGGRPTVKIRDSYSERDMKLGSVIYETRGKLAILTMDEPKKLNALSDGIRSGILDGLKKVDADDSVRVAIITGGGEKAFCAGADIGSFDFDPEKARNFMAETFELLTAPERCKKPVIAAVNGVAFGGGFELAIASDFIIASERAKFAVPEIKLGLLPAFAIVRLGDIVGRAKAKELSILGDPITAEEARALGIALRVVPHETLLEAAIEFGDRIASRPRLSVQMAKSFYNRGLGGDEMRHTLDGFPYLFMHEDAREGIASFREGRQPRFKD
jgi:enoyl-CoA hydratase/carnithine racemase